MLQRYLQSMSASEENIHLLSFPDLIKKGWQKELLKSEWATWKVYRNARNITLHTYDKKKALQVLTIIPDFLQDAVYLYDKLAE